MGLAFPLRLKAVIIDLDGTLLDTIPDLAAAANMMLEEMGRPGLPVDVLRTFVGKGIPRLVERALAGSIDGHAEPAVLEHALPLYERCYDAVNGSRTTMYPGAKEGLEALRGQSFPLACVTNKSARFTQPLLDSMQLTGYFAEIVAGDALPRKKPDPLPLTHVCERFGIVPREMLMIGDSLNDAQAARAAGCPVFCVDYGYNEGRDVRELDIDAIVSSIYDATRLIQKA